VVSKSDAVAVRRGMVDGGSRSEKRGRMERVEAVGRSGDPPIEFVSKLSIQALFARCPGGGTTPGGGPLRTPQGR